MAARFWIGGGTNTNWTSSPSTNWAATSGDTVRVAAPTSSDDVTFDGAGVTGNSASVISATITVLSFTVTSGYTQTITHNAVLTIAGNVTFNTSYTIAGASNITISAASTITSGGKTWPNGVTFSGANTKTLVGNWTVSGSLALTIGNCILNWTTNEVLSIAGITGSLGISGTAAITLTGGTWSNTGGIQNNLTIAGNVTVSGNVPYNTGTLTYSSGTVTTTSSTLTIGASTTLNTTGISWNNITISSNSVTLTINSLLTATGTFSLGSSSGFVFAGTAGATIGTFSCTHTSVATVTFANTVTYTITTALNAFNSRTGSILTFTSDHATNKAILTLNNGATCNVLASFTRIDASGGRTINTFNGTVTTCININSFNDLTNTQMTSNKILNPSV